MKLPRDSTRDPCNGIRKQAEEIRGEVRNFLESKLRLTLSMEKTKVTHLNDGFDFLGFTIRRSMGHDGMKTKVLISVKGMEKHKASIAKATSACSSADSVGTKIKAINRNIAGWCRYYQYTSRAQRQFSQQETDTFWRMAHWFGRKFEISIANGDPILQGRTHRRRTNLAYATYRFSNQEVQATFPETEPIHDQGENRKGRTPYDNPWPGMKHGPAQMISVFRSWSETTTLARIARRNFLRRCSK